MAIYHNGTSGGLGGGDFDDEDDADRVSANLSTQCRLAIVRIHSGIRIDAIQTTIFDKQNNRFHDLPRRGSPGGGETRIDLNNLDELLLEIRGTYDFAVRSMLLTILNHKTGATRVEGPFGDSSEGHRYRYRALNTPNSDNGILGFWGRSGAHLDAIGALTQRPRVT